jgi:hypothetical protein
LVVWGRAELFIASVKLAREATSRSANGLTNSG